jgi:MYXO-CTERM domain-containing protein
MTLSFPGRLLVLGCLVAGPALAQEWVHPGGDPLASGLLQGAGAMTSEEADRPGVSWAVSLGDTAFSPDQVLDIDGDGDSEVLLPFRQRVAAFDLITGALAWTTPPLGVTQVLPPADLLCDGSGPQVLALNSKMGGGLHLVDPLSGALIWTFSELDSASGVGPQEFAMADVDGDGCDEMVFGAFLNQAVQVYLVDLSTPDGQPRIAVGALSGAYKQVTRLSIGDYDGDGVANEVLLYEREAIDIKQVCGPADGGTCDDVDGSVCLCDLAFFDTVYAPGAFPQPITVNTDGGADEVLVVHDSPTFVRGFGLLQPAVALNGGQSNAELGAWYYDYSADGTRVLDMGPPRDLNGDGALDLVVTLFDAGTGEVDWSGASTDDGVANAGGFAVGVFDLGTGALQAFVADRYALGVVDLDGDGSLEIVTATTTGQIFSGGTTEAFELDCGATCSLASAWTAADRAIRFPAVFDGLDFPARSLVTMSSGGGGAIGLWDGDDLVSFASDGAGGVTELGRQSLSEGDTVVLDADGLDAVLVGLDSGFVAPYGGNLAALGAAYRPPSQAIARILSVVLSDTETRAVPIIDGLVYHSALSPSDPGEADADLGGDVLIAQDMDDDGMTDLITYRYIVADGSFEVARHEYVGNGAFEQRWVFASAGDASLAGKRLLNPWGVGLGDFNGDDVDDVIIHFALRNDGALRSFDGLTGAVDWVASTTARRAGYAPLIPWDITGPGGWGTPDGVPDLIRPVQRHITGWQYPNPTPDTEVVTADFNSQWSGGDMDGDGKTELVTGLTGRLDRAQVEVWDFDPNIQLLWGPVTDVGAPPDVEQGVALADLDPAAGLDVVYISSEGRIDAMSGRDGVTVAGFPYYLGDGVGSTSPIVPRQSLTAVIASDVDGDGLDEIVVGSRAGWLYAVNAADGEGGVSVEWAMFLGAPVVRLAGGDVDDDGENELLVSTEDGLARAIDAIGASIAILIPQPDDCVSGRRIVVAGSSAAVESVEVFVQGLSGGVATPDSAGNWSVEVGFPLVNGTVELRAVGYTGGVAQVITTVSIQSAVGDLDQDGVTTCGGDCDDADPAVYPDAEEICDGLDNDCDPETVEDVDADGDGVSNCDEPPDCDDAEATVFPAEVESDCDDGLDNDCDTLADAADSDCDEDTTPPVTEPPDGTGCAGCDCESNQGGGGPGALALPFGLLAFVGRRRRIR